MTATQLELVRPTRELDLDAAGILLYNASWDTAQALVGPAQLLVVDPPWLYSQKFGKGTPYQGMKTKDVKVAVETMCSWVDGPARLLLWTTWPLMPELWGWLPGSGFKFKTGGAWTKSGPNDTGHYGAGYHHAGCSEPFLLFTKGSAPNSREKLRNSWISSPTEHSAKPRLWSRQQVRRWTSPGALVWEPFAGTAPLATACLLEGRRYVGTEVDPKTYAAAKAGIGGWSD